jgi:hypothetical protein
MVIFDTVEQCASDLLRLEERATRSGLLSRLPFAILLVATIGCSSSGSGGKGGAGGAGVGAGGASGTIVVSCTQAGIDCLEVTVFPTEVSGEQSACATSVGTFAMAPCPSTGFVACCDKPSAQEMQCYFPSQNTVLYKNLCAGTNGTWVVADGGVSDAGPADAGAAGAAAFVGTWARSGTETLTCSTGTPTTATIKGNLAITLGTTSSTIVGTAPDGCMTIFTVSGNVATATAGQTCNTTTDAGVAETITVNSRTLTLSADGKSLDVAGNETVDKTAAGTTCTRMGSGTYTKV